MDIDKYFDFSSLFDKNFSAILSKRNVLPYQLSHTEKIKHFLNELLIDNSRIGIPYQTHSNNCTIINDNGMFENTDGLITQNPNLILSLSVADCCPIFIFDRVLNIRGLVHSGWKGSVDKIILNAINKFEELGSKIQDLCIFIGPSIGGCCYEVGKEVSDFIQKDCKSENHDNKFFIDIKKQIQKDLLKIGVKKSQIQMSSICTLENEECESYRRDGDKSGRMIALFGNFNL